LIEKNLLTIAILEGIEKSEGCALCYLWVKSEENHMQHLLRDEVVMDPEFREKVIASGGFCNRHAHLLYKAAYKSHTEDGLGYALYMKDVVRKIIDELAPFSADNSSDLRSLNKQAFLGGRRRKALSVLSRKIRRAVQGREDCPACEYLRSMDQIRLHTLVQMLDDEDFRKEFESSNGLCLPHFVSAIQMVCASKLTNPSQVSRDLIKVEMKRFELVESLLSEFVRKQSWDFRNEPIGPEVHANSLVMNLLVGAEGIYSKNQTALLQTKEAIGCEEIDDRAIKESKTKLKDI
jgi:hypothetical protein